MPFNDKDFYEPESFREKLRSHTLDILFIVFFTGILCLGLHSKKSDKPQQCVQTSMQIHKSINDSISQKVR